ncbi:Hypothetical predicted protein [Mytilus galloprovincialis]|uniref:Short-chain collagen C4-like n=1 Tax=Mytilus galloprovincialis TaxID=29158 RepID=A0A8B6BSR1_MYTGA|nr:Hypothetical predicted protein [Mytilus galloprovincialis]
MVDHMQVGFRRMVDHMQVGSSTMNGGSHASWIFDDGWWITCRLESSIDENSGETYIRWGMTSCPEESYLVYDGYAAGKHYNMGGSGANLLCLPKNPEWKEYTEGNSSTWTGKLFGVEYEIGENKPYSKTFLNQDMPCAVCESKRSTVLMVPGKVTCHEGWHKEFSGYLMSQTSRNDRSPTEYICADEQLESVPGGDADRNEAVLYPVEAVCGSLKCPPYVNGRELTCVVCSK